MGFLYYSLFGTSANGCTARANPLFGGMRCPSALGRTRIPHTPIYRSKNIFVTVATQVQLEQAVNSRIGLVTTTQRQVEQRCAACSGDDLAQSRLLIVALCILGRKRLIKVLVAVQNQVRARVI